MIAAKFNNPDGSVTFENPGSLPIIKNAILFGDLPFSAIDYAKTYSKNYVNDINFINTINPQASQTYVVGPHEYDFNFRRKNPTLKISSVYIMNAYYWMSYSLDQHLMSGLYEKIKKGATFEYDFNRPVGLQNAYKEYINYYVRYEYWDAYAKYLWDHNIEALQQNYKNYSEFHKGFVNDLKKLYDRRFLSEDKTLGFFTGKFNNVEPNDKNSGPSKRLRFSG